MPASLTLLGTVGGPDFSQGSRPPAHPLRTAPDLADYDIFTDRSLPAECKRRTSQKGHKAVRMTCSRWPGKRPLEGRPGDLLPQLL